MILTKEVPFKEITKQLKKSDKIGIVSCNSCAKMCNTGGDAKMKEIESKLKKEGYTIVDRDLIGIACDFDQMKVAEMNGNCSIVLACDAGVYNLRKLYPRRKLVSGTKSIGLGAWDHKGNFHLVRKFC